MSANREDTVVINPPALKAPTTARELSPYNQAKLLLVDAIKIFRLDGTYAAPEGMEEWQRMSPGKTSTEWVIWRNSQKAATAIAKDREVKLLPFETRSFNYARIKEDEASQLHALSFKESRSMRYRFNFATPMTSSAQGDEDKDGSAQSRDKQDNASSIGKNEHFSPSCIEDDLAEGNLGDDLDRLLKSSSSLSPVNGVNQDDAEDENHMVDYDEDDDEDDFIRNERAKTMSAKTFGDNRTEGVEAHDNTVAEDEDKLGDEDFAQSEPKESKLEGQPKEECREVDAQATDALQLAEISANSPVVKPVLTQKGIMDIIASQPHALMQKMEWEQKKQCYKEMLSGYESPNVCLRCV
jgi:hypothetical protein